jgi:hypothetical protein
MIVILSAFWTKVISVDGSYSAAGIVSVIRSAVRAGSIFVCVLLHYKLSMAKTVACDRREP